MSCLFPGTSRLGGSGILDVETRLTSGTIFLVHAQIRAIVFFTLLSIVLCTNSSASGLTPKQFDSLFQKFSKEILPQSIMTLQKKTLSAQTLYEFWAEAARRTESLKGTQPETNPQFDRGLLLWVIAKEAEFTYAVITNRISLKNGEAEIKKVESEVIVQNGGQLAYKVDPLSFSAASSGLKKILNDARTKAQTRTASLNAQMSNFVEMSNANKRAYALFLRDNELAEQTARHLPLPLPGGAVATPESASTSVAVYQPLLSQAFQEDSSPSALLRAQTSASLAGLTLMNLRRLSLLQLSNSAQALQSIASITGTTASAFSDYPKISQNSWALLGYASSQEAAAQANRDTAMSAGAFQTIQSSQTQFQSTKQLMTATLSQISEWGSKLPKRTAALDAKIKKISAAKDSLPAWDQALVDELTLLGSQLARLPDSNQQLKSRIDSTLARLQNPRPDEHVNLIWDLRAIDKNLSFNSWLISRSAALETNLLATSKPDAAGGLARMKGSINLAAEAKLTNSLRQSIADRI